MNSIFQNSIMHGLYNQDISGHELLTPKLLVNQDQPIWFNLRNNLQRCKSFTWAVAFITEDMLTPFKLVMEDLNKKGIRGSIITSDYLGFNSPKMFKELLKIPNLTVKLSEQAGFHAKGYLFEHDGYQTALIGSSNFTRSALLKNMEWTIEISSRDNSALTNQINSQLSELEKSAIDLTSDWIDNYEKSWQPPAKNTQIKHKSEEVIPNQMQKAALSELNSLVEEGEKRGLVVSATGTGKTYLGAFAVKDFAPKRFLYVVHRSQIAKKSMASFKKVIGGKESDYGLLSGNHHDLEKKYLFATIQTLSQDHILDQLPRDTFDYILIDEAHRVGAPSYKKVMQYFNPKFYLGLTATPERMDQQDVFKIFDYNLAYEIRLRNALENEMLAPFHYVGVEDYILNGETIDEASNLTKLTYKARVKYVLKELAYYGYCGSSPKGLVFCSRRQEAKRLAQMFTEAGFASRALTNEDSESHRQKVVQELEKGDLNYIFTVDLFNEGIDIPALNQIVMLRNTQSSIVFIQQLGRGLRKYPGKDFVTVIDFIANYKNNYLIPLALNDDRSKSKDRARTEVKMPELMGVSTINFSEIASQKILNSLEQVKLDSIKELRSSYQDLKEKLGRIPYLIDFEKFGSTAASVFINNRSLKHYGEFLQKMGENITLTRYENAVLYFLTKEIANGKRPHELILLKMLLESNTVKKTDYVIKLKQNGIYVNDDVLTSVDNILTLDFFNVKVGKTTRKSQYGNQPIIKSNPLEYWLNHYIVTSLTNPNFAKIFEDVIDLGLLLNKKYDSAKQFTIYQQYDREDVCRLLNWLLDVSAPMYGYRVGKNETPIFITYKKDSSKKRNSIYDNNLEDGQSLHWYTRSPRHIDSDEVKRLLTPGMKIRVFVKQSDQVGKEFFYLGQAEIEQKSIKEEKIGPKKKTAVGMKLKLKQPLSAKMYDLLFDDVF